MLGVALSWPPLAVVVWLAVCYAFMALYTHFRLMNAAGYCWDINRSYLVPILLLFIGLLFPLVWLYYLCLAFVRLAKHLADLE